MRRFAVGVVAAAWVVAGALPASAHGDLRDSSPVDGTSLRRPPAKVTLTLTEPPGPGTTVRVTDGCKRKVAARVAQSGNDVTVAISGGEPGRWHVVFRAVSSVDGHTSKGGIRFTVRGKKDCSKPDDETDTEIGGGDETLIEAEPSTGGDFPVGLVVVGSAVVIGAALILRRISSQ